MLKKHINNDIGWTLVELMTVVGVIAILAAIAIPNYLGLQEKAKRKVILELSSSAKPELYAWIEAAVKGERGVVDVDGNGIVDPLEIHTGLMSIPNSWIQAYYKKTGKRSLSPWFPTKGLFTVAPLNPPQFGQIVFSVINFGRGIHIRAYGKDGVMLHGDTVSLE